MRMQLRLRSFFIDVMAGGETALAVQEAGNEAQEGDPHTPAHSTAHMHVTWTDFLGFSKVSPSLLRHILSTEVFHVLPPYSIVCRYVRLSGTVSSRRNKS